MRPDTIESAHPSASPTAPLPRRCFCGEDSACVEVEPVRSVFTDLFCKHHYACASCGAEFVIRVESSSRPILWLGFAVAFALSPLVELHSVGLCGLSVVAYAVFFSVMSAAQRRHPESA